jgi:hypothetical protein
MQPKHGLDLHSRNTYKDGASLRNRRSYFFLSLALNLMGAWCRSIQAPHQKLLKSRTGADAEKGLSQLLDNVTAKKNVLFCDGEVFLKAAF